ncbi:MAG TPA: Rho termination factor N-terminal domain-containing protein, partial [Polyangiaceae bacterium]|nr:Rho termination factor N-terminal domain-containing protein [Polyangiaceae bacterium]
MTFDLRRLDEMPRAELIALANQYGIERPERMTRVELKDELVRVSITDAALRERSRGWLGVARDLVASVVEAGLHMPDAAKVIRGDVQRIDASPRRPPVATVTLAEIYAAQGHTRRAL